MKTQKIKIGVLAKDNGDGSSAIYLFPSFEEAKAYWMNENGWETEDDIPDETNWYDNGSISHDTLNVVIDDDGNISLAQYHYFEGGDQ